MMCEHRRSSESLLAHIAFVFFRPSRIVLCCKIEILTQMENYKNIKIWKLLWNTYQTHCLHPTIFDSIAFLLNHIRTHANASVDAASSKMSKKTFFSTHYTCAASEPLHSLKITFLFGFIISKAFVCIFPTFFFHWLTSMSFSVRVHLGFVLESPIT